MQQMIKNDGGDGDYIEDTSMGMLGVWSTLLTGKADATWVFLAWEGVIAKLKGLQLNAFQLDEYNVSAAIPEYQYPSIQVFATRTGCSKEPKQFPGPFSSLPGPSACRFRMATRLCLQSMRTPSAPPNH